MGDVMNLCCYYLPSPLSARTRAQVDPSKLPSAVSSEDYNPPSLDEVEFEQVWTPLPVGEDGCASTDPDTLVEEFGCAVSHDKVGVLPVISLRSPLL